MLASDLQRFAVITTAAICYLHLCLVGLLCVKAETLPRTSPAGSTRSLLGRGLADGCDEQRLHSDAGIVHLHESGQKKKKTQNGLFIRSLIRI